MEDNKKIKNDKIESFRNIIIRTLDLLLRIILDNNSLSRLSKATTEALLIGIAKNINDLEKENADLLEERYATLRNDDLFSIDSLKEGLAQKERVINRLNRAIEIFS